MSRKQPLEQTRNIGIMAHIDAGKTTTTERILFYSGKVHRIGEVDDGAATMDWMVQEKERGITITSAATSFDWKLNNKLYHINLIDTPGHVDFTIEVERSLRVLDGAVAIFCAVGGVEPQSETVWHQADKYNIPRIVYVNKMDRIGADFHYAVTSVRERLGAPALPIQLPVGSEDTFSAIIDLITRTTRYFDEESYGIDYKDIDEIPDELKDEVEYWHERLLETLADIDDSIMEKYIEGIEPTIEEIYKALRKATLEVKLFPILVGSSLKNKGVQALLDSIMRYLPSPADVPPIEGHIPDKDKIIFRKPDDDEPFSALVFKIQTDSYVGKLSYIRVYSGKAKQGGTLLNLTTGKKDRLARLLLMHSNKRQELSEIRTGDIVAVVGLRNPATGSTLCDIKNPIQLEAIEFPEPVIFIAIEPKSKADEEKLLSTLERLKEEDPTFKSYVNEETGQLIISGMGELHLEVLVDRMLREFQVKANVGKPQVAYHETITKKAEAHGKFIKQTGGHGQYGDVILRVEPLPRGDGFIFESIITGKDIPNQFIRHIKRSIEECMESGPLAGYEMQDIKVTLIGGSYHEVDSSDIAYRVAASQGFREAVGKAKPILLEPIMEAEIVTPEISMGDVINDINSRRGSIHAMNKRGDAQIIDASVPLASMFGYATSLRNVSKGRATYTMQFKCYAAVPVHISEELLSQFRGYT